MTATTRTYVLTLEGGLLGLERLIGLLRRRRVVVPWLSIQKGASTAPTRVTIRVESKNHDQVARQLDRLVEIVTHTIMEENDHDNQ